MDECKPLPCGAFVALRGGSGIGVVLAGAATSAAPLAGGVQLGRAVQVDSIKPKVKPPGTKRLKLELDHMLSSCAFNLSTCGTTARSAPPDDV